MGYQVLGAVLAYVGLQGVYRLIESSWPENYFSLADYTSYRKTVKPLAYLVFRFVPVFAITLFLAVSLERGNKRVWLATGAFLAAHIASTHGHAIGSIWSRRNDPRRSPLVALHGFASVCIVGVGVLAVLLRDPLAPLIPPLESLAGELWGAALAGAFGAYLLSRTASAPVDPTGLVLSARRRIDPALVSFARSEAERNGADPDLVEAILVTESLQRPRWFRTLEVAKSWIFRHGTYGIMQVEHRGAVDDRESIRIATSGPLAGQQLPIANQGATSYLDTERLRAQLRHYNRSPVWADMVLDVLNVIRPG